MYQFILKLRLSSDNKDNLCMYVCMYVEANIIMLGIYNSMQ